MKKLKIFLLLSILLCFGFTLSSEVHAQGGGPKVFEEGDVLPATTQLKISWDNTFEFTHPFPALIIETDGNTNFQIRVGVITLGTTEYHFRLTILSDMIYIVNNSNWQSPYSEYGGSGQSYIIVDISQLTEEQRTITIANTINGLYWEDLNAEPEPEGYTITFNSNGGTSIPDIEEVTVLPTPLPRPTRSGYIFVAWYYDSAFTQIANPGDIIENNVILYARWENIEEVILEPKVFEVGDVLPATTRLRISWRGTSLRGMPYWPNLGTGGINFASSSSEHFISFTGEPFFGISTWYIGGIKVASHNGTTDNFYDEITNNYVDIDTSTWTLEQRTVTTYSTHGEDIYWMDISYLDAYTLGYLAAREYYGWYDDGNWYTGDEVWDITYVNTREEFGYYDPITNRWLSVDEYLDLYGTERLGETDFYNNFDKYFIPAMIIVFGGAIVLTILKVFKGRE